MGHRMISCGGKGSKIQNTGVDDSLQSGHGQTIPHQSPTPYVDQESSIGHEYKESQTPRSVAESITRQKLEIGDSLREPGIEDSLHGPKISYWAPKQGIIGSLHSHELDVRSQTGH